ncbi:hypothetical protein [Achromobacter phage kuwaak_TL2]|nr:hypothetical protein [Achromobacter phage kuwaak_TL2]
MHARVLKPKRTLHMKFITHNWIGKTRVLSFDSESTHRQFMKRFGYLGDIREITSEEALAIVVNEGQPADVKSDFRSHVHITATAFEALGGSQPQTSM